MGLGSLTVAVEMLLPFFSWDGGAYLLSDRWLFQTSHNFDTVTLGRMGFLLLAGTKMSLEAKEVNSLSQLPLGRASCRFVNDHPRALPGSHSLYTPVVLAVMCDLFNVKFCSAFVAGRQSCWRSCFYSGKFHPPWAMHQGALPHHSDCGLSN